MDNDYNCVPGTSRQQVIPGRYSNNDHNAVPATSAQLSTCNVVAIANEFQGATLTTTSATATIFGLLPQHSVNARCENQSKNPGSPYAGSSNTVTAFQNPPSFSVPAHSSHNPPKVSENASPEAAAGSHIGPENSSVQMRLQQLYQSNEANPKEYLISYEKILEEMLESPQFSKVGEDGSVRANTEIVGGIAQPSSSNFFGGSTVMTTNEIFDNNSGQAGVAGHGNANAIPRVGDVNRQLQEFSNQAFNGLGATNSFNNFQFDRK